MSNLLNRLYFVDLWAYALSVETWSFQYVAAYLDGAGCKREGVVIYQNCNSLMANNRYRLTPGQSLHYVCGDRVWWLNTKHVIRFITSRSNLPIPSSVSNCYTHESCATTVFVVCRNTHCSHFTAVKAVRCRKTFLPNKQACVRLSHVSLIISHYLWMIGDKSAVLLLQYRAVNQAACVKSVNKPQQYKVFRLTSWPWNDFT